MVAIQPACVYSWAKIRTNLIRACVIVCPNWAVLGGSPFVRNTARWLLMNSGEYQMPSAGAMTTPARSPAPWPLEPLTVSTQLPEFQLVSSLDTPPSTGFAQQQQALCFAPKKTLPRNSGLSSHANAAPLASAA